jgi:CPA2 family monovalent cation:H+ antiporter-2
LIIVWLWLLSPVSGATFWFFGSLIISAAALGISWRNRFVTIHHDIGTELYQAILSSEERQQRVREEWLKEHQEWDLHLAEIEVPDSYTWFGKSLGDLALRSQFGCSVVGVDRQGYSVPSPGPDTELYPKDKLLVLGAKTQTAAVRAFFAASEPDSTKADLLDEIRLESIEVPAESRLAGNALAELEIPRHTGVQIAGVARGEYKMLFPGPFQVLMPGDWLLVVGTREQIQHFREWMMGPETQPE